MPRLSEFRLIYQQEQPVLVITARINLENLTNVVKESKEKIKEYIKKIGEYPSDVPFITYHNDDLDNLDIEICCPIRKPLKGDGGEIRYSSIPQSKVIVCMLRGAHEERKKIYMQMLKWIEDNGFKYAGKVYEYFYFDSRETENPDIFAKVMMTVE